LLLIKGGVQAVGEKTFAQCESLDLVVVPSTLVVIGGDAFEGDVNISSVSAPYWMTYKNSGLFRFCRNLTITGNGAIPELAFKGNGSLQNVILDSGITEIGRMSFMNCPTLEAVLVSDSVEHIRGSAFFGCSNLEQLMLSEGLEGIDDAAFAYCTSLRLVYLPSSLAYVGSASFAQCTDLSVVSFALAPAVVDKLSLSDTGLGSVLFATESQMPAGYPWGNIHVTVRGGQGGGNEASVTMGAFDDVLRSLKKVFSDDATEREEGKQELLAAFPGLSQVADEAELLKIGEILLLSMPADI
ncbi:MAG: leucine-rich repeat domain-containing protein, partial [Sphaerochaetaceae bacterium]